MSSVTGTFCGGFFAVVAWASVAVAQPAAVDEAWALYGQAEFEAALETLEAAEQAGHIPTESYPRALEIRALAAFALGRADVVTSALERLAAVDPDYGLGPEATPPLREELDVHRRARRDQATRLDPPPDDRRAPGERALLVPAAAAPAPADEGGIGTAGWLALGGAAVLLVGAIVAIVLVTGQTSDAATVETMLPWD